MYTISAGGRQGDSSRRLEGVRDTVTHENRRRYQEAGFGRPAGRGSRPGIVVVDFTRGFTDPQYPTGADLTDEVLATGRLLDAARARGLFVVFTAISYETDAEGHPWVAKAPGLKGLRAGTPLVELDERLPRRPEEPLVIKKGASAFFGTNLAAMLVAQHVDTVILCGATTSGCVRASAVDAVQSGFPTVVPRECVGDRAREPHEANLFDINEKYGDVISLEEALGYLEGLGATVDSGAPARL
jgi:nicotinamidase-related amidase